MAAVALADAGWYQAETTPATSNEEIEMTSTREILAAQTALAAEAAKADAPAVPAAHGFPSGFSAEQFAKIIGLLEPIAEVNILMLPLIRAQVAEFEARQATPQPGPAPEPAAALPAPDNDPEPAAEPELDPERDAPPQPE